MKILFSVKTMMMFAWCRKTIDLTNKKLKFLMHLEVSDHNTV